MSTEYLRWRNERNFALAEKAIAVLKEGKLDAHEYANCLSHLVTVVLLMITKDNDPVHAIAVLKEGLAPNIEKRLRAVLAATPGVTQ